MFICSSQKRMKTGFHFITATHAVLSRHGINMDSLTHLRLYSPVTPLHVALRTTATSTAAPRRRRPRRHRRPHNCLKSQPLPKRKKPHPTPLSPLTMTVSRTCTLGVMSQLSSQSPRLRRSPSRLACPSRSLNPNQSGPGPLYWLRQSLQRLHQQGKPLPRPPPLDRPNPGPSVAL